MRINTNTNAINALRQFAVNNTSQTKNLEKLSSGSKINRAGDDASGLSISEKMKSQIRGLDQAVSNAEDGISLIQTAEGGLNETHEILQRMNELATKAANDTLAAEDRTAITDEITELTAEIDRIAESTSFNGTKLLNGDLAAADPAAPTDDEGLNLQIGTETSDVLKITIAAADTAGLGIDALDVTDHENAQLAMEAIDSAIETVSGLRSKLGANQNRLEHTVNNLSVTSENLSTANSRIRDVDMAKEMTEFTKNSILSQAAQAMIAQAKQQPEGIIQLLR